MFFVSISGHSPSKPWKQMFVNVATFVEYAKAAFFGEFKSNYQHIHLVYHQFIILFDGYNDINGDNNDMDLINNDIVRLNKWQWT